MLKVYLCTGQRVRIHGEIIKERFNKKTVQTAVMRCRVQSGKHTDWRHFTHD